MRSIEYTTGGAGSLLHHDIMMSEHNEATPTVRFFPELLLLFLLGLFPLYLIFPTSVLPVIQWNVLNFFFYTQATSLVLCKPLLDQVAAFITAALSKFTPTLNDNIWIAKQTRASFHWLLQSGNLLYGGFVPVVILVLPYLESISNLNDRRVRWIWQTNRPRVSAPFCCSATPQTPVLGLHLVISVSFPILRAGCPRLSTSTAGSCRTQNHSPRLVQHVLLTGWGAILEALSFPGKEPAHSPHYYSTNMSLLHCKDFPSPMC